jgi:hypothetical protein
MRWNLCYGLMTTCLAGVAGYSVYSSPLSAREATSRFNDALTLARAHQVRHMKPCHPGCSKPAGSCTAADAGAAHKDLAVAPSAQVNGSAADPVAALGVGCSRELVRNALGKPTVVSANDNLWTYGSRAVIFSNDKVAGWMDVDPGAALGMAPSADRQLASTRAAADAATGAAKKGAKKRQATRTATKIRKAIRRARYVYQPLFTPTRFVKPRYSKPDWLKSWSRYRDRQRLLNNRYQRYTNGRYLDGSGRTVTGGRRILHKSGRRARQGD